MKNSNIIIALAALVIMCGCQASKVKISGRFIGGDVKDVYLEQSSTLSPIIVDSTRLADDGSYSFTVGGADKTPTLYHIIYNGERIPLLVSGGDRLEVNTVGSVVRNYTVEGSEESELLRGFYQSFVAGARQLEQLAAKFSDENLGEDERRELAEQYTQSYYGVRRNQLRFIIENKSSLAAVYAIYQRLPGDTHLFDGDSDVVYYRTVAEAVAERYPESPYRTLLESEVKAMDARIALASQIVESTYPDLELADIYGKKIKLSSLAGKVVLLDFWSAELGNSNVYNAELKQTYEKYSKAATPLEVYQVAVDTSKLLWITAVQEQQLPWISVSDLKGRASRSLALYNVQKLPANFLIDSKGTIVAKDIYGRSLEEKLEELTR